MAELCSSNSTTTILFHTKGKESFSVYIFPKYFIRSSTRTRALMSVIPSAGICGMLACLSLFVMRNFAYWVFGFCPLAGQRFLSVVKAYETPREFGLVFSSFGKPKIFQILIHSDLMIYKTHMKTLTGRGWAENVPFSTISTNSVTCWNFRCKWQLCVILSLEFTPSYDCPL